jgi:lysophospholipase L1-like esterase
MKNYLFLIHRVCLVLKKGYSLASKRFGLIAISILASTVMFLSIQAQDCYDIPAKPSYFLGKENLNSIFESLMAIQKDSSKSLNILHIGDSHIQGNYLTDKIRYNFYNDFGLGDKGLTFPFKLAKTNSPAEIKCFSYFRWENKKNTQFLYSEKMGISGRTLVNYYANTQFEIKIPPAFKDYYFDQLSVLYTPSNQYSKVTVKDSNSVILKKTSSDVETGFIVDHYSSPHLLNQFKLQFSNTNRSKYAPCALHGICLKNTRRGGINYHVTGVNGSQYRNWAASSTLARQSSYLNPQLIIISLGTNDANDLLLTTVDFTNYMDHLVGSLKKANPKAKFILTTPPDSYFRRRYVNKEVDRIRQAIIQYAEKNKLACWDLYDVMGGAGSIKAWYDQGLAAQDLIHFSKTGYEIQGQLFYEAFIKHYKEYAADRLK